MSESGSTLCACLSPDWSSSSRSVPLHGDGLILSIDGIVTAAEAKRLVQCGERLGFTTQFHEADDEITYRHNDRLAVRDACLPLRRRNDSAEVFPTFW